MEEANTLALWSFVYDFEASTYFVHTSVLLCKSDCGMLGIPSRSAKYFEYFDFSAKSSRITNKLLPLELNA
jgi:hypothetical protein